MNSALRLPDFFIVGAMKSGTTSLHAALAEHPAVYMPPGEVGFFDHDDFFEHVDNFVASDGGWRERAFALPPSPDLDWYAGLFAGARPDQVIGVDSTTYLSSWHAPARIALQQPGARIIVMLRDPVARAYSQYWHMLQSGSMLYSFEDSLRLMPERLLQRSLYLPALQRYLAHFPREQLHVILFEAFITAPLQQTAATLAFLDIDATGFTPPPEALHRNAARLPRWPRLQQWRNRLRWREQFIRMVQHPGNPGPGTGSTMRAAARRAFRRLNPMGSAAVPPMREDTRRLLNSLLRRENEGLSELIGMDLDRYWYRT